MYLKCCLPQPTGERERGRWGANDCATQTPQYVEAAKGDKFCDICSGTVPMADNWSVEWSGGVIGKERLVLEVRIFEKNADVKHGSGLKWWRNNP